MAIRIVPYAADHVPMVARFNARMAKAGSDWAFYEDHHPSWIPKDAVEDPSVWREYHVAVENEAEVRGAYCLKPQRFVMNGQETWMANWQGPVSEGLVDRRYGMLALKFMSHMQGLQPNLFAWGASDKMVALLKNLKWHCVETPIYLRVLRGRRFAANIRALRGSTRNRVLLDIAGTVGAASVGFALLQRPRRRRDVRFEGVDRFGDWADVVWAAAKDSYGMIAVRDAATLNHLMAAPGWPEVEILKVSVGGRLVGWAAIRATDMTDHVQYGDMRVGSLIDCLALPGEEQAVTAAASQALADRRVDVIATNMVHAAWDAALKQSGFLAVPNRRLFGLSPGFGKTCGPIDAAFLAGVHLTPIDGDGPRGL